LGYLWSSGPYGIGVDVPKTMADGRNGNDVARPSHLIHKSNMLGLARAWADHSQPEVPANFIPVHRLSFLLHAVIVSDPLFLAGFP
jgi:hypothetical protein